MAVEQLAQDSDATRRVSELPGESDPRRTPDESTVGMASPPTVPEPAPVGADVAPLEIGEILLGRFSVLRLIAQGGMGAVYEAHDSVLRTSVALKLIRRRIAQDRTAMERFRREVLLARQVSHHNVCRVYELYEATTAAGEPVQFLTMELLVGETLSRKLAREGRLSTAQALPLATQMCAGLAAAHAEGVVHRDFKSSNVMLVPRAEVPGEPSTGTTRVAITDFGVACALSAAGDGEERLTGEAGVLGTPEYMAPEQVTGGEVTPATDIYALGVVLYEMVTGKLPFAGDTPLIAAARRLNEAAPRPELIAPGLEARWSRAIVRCLAREPRRRFESALEVSEALGGQTRRWRRPQVAVVLALSALLGAVAAVWTVPKVQSWRTRHVATVAAPRPAVAILGFANSLPAKSLPWLPTAVEEMLRKELASAETSIRALSTDWVADARRSLGVTAEQLPDVETRKRLQGLLVANRLVYGDIAPSWPGSDAVQLRLHLLDGPTGKELAVFSEELGPGATQLPEALGRVGGRVREALHAPLTSEEEAALTASRMKSLEAAQVYATGVARLRAFDYAQARDSFQAALAHDSSLVDAEWRIAASWQAQGYRKKAREVAEHLVSRKQLLTAGQAAELGAWALVLGEGGEDLWLKGSKAAKKGLDARVAVFNTRPDDEEFGLGVAFDNAPANIELALVKRLRLLPRPLSDDLRLDLAEAEALFGTDTTRAHRLLDDVERRAGELGARSEQALAYRIRGDLLYATNRRSEAVTSLRKAVRLFSEVGELRAAAFAACWMTFVTGDSGTIREGRVAVDEALAALRRIGYRAWLRTLLCLSAHLYLWSGDAENAKKRLDEASSEGEFLEGPDDTACFAARFRVFTADADIAGQRAALQQWRREGEDSSAGLSFEATLLWEQDRLEESLVTQRRLVAAAAQRGDKQSAEEGQLGICASECERGHLAEGLACLEALPHFPHAGVFLENERHMAEARCKYLAKDFPGAETAMRAVAPADPDQFQNRTGYRIQLARVMAANGKTAKAIADLRSILADIESRPGYRAFGFRASLALGEAELMAGMAAGRPRLVRLEQEAKSREFFRIARLAREALDRNRPGKRGASAASR